MTLIYHAIATSQPVNGIAAVQGRALVSFDDTLPNFSEYVLVCESSQPFTLNPTWGPNAYTAYSSIGFTRIDQEIYMTVDGA